jgi:hypothetical protein
VTGPIDYQAVLADLEAKRSQIEAAIAGIKAMLAGGPTEGEGPPTEDEPPAGAAPVARQKPSSSIIRNDTFFGLSTSKAIRKFLAMTKRPQTPRAIADALHQGGQVHALDEKVAYTNTYTALTRLKNSGVVVQIKSGEWGLAEWYGNKPKAEGANDD